MLFKKMHDLEDFYINLYLLGMVILVIFMFVYAVIVMFFLDIIENSKKLFKLKRS